MVTLHRLFPILHWLANYPRHYIAYDGFAAIITAILFIPQGIAYALLAGLPPQVGLYASILPPLTYALFGTSRTLSVGPVSIAAIMIASALAAPNLMQYGSPIQHALILAVEGGLILILMAIFRLGSLVRFISQPVLSGFTSGAALLIIVSQLPQLVGYPSQPAIEGAAFSSYIPLMIGLGSVILLLAMGKPLKQLLKAWRWPTKAIIACQKTAPLLVVVISTSCVLHYDFGSDGSVAIVGPIPDGLPTIQTSFLFYSLDHWLALLPSAAFIAIIAYVESIAIALVTANMRDEKIDSQQELIALGMANISSAFSGGMTVAGGFSRTMVNFSAGARSQLAMVLAVLFLAVALLLLTDYFSQIPHPALAAIITIAIFPLIKLSGLVETYRQDHHDAFHYGLTLFSVVFIGIEVGLAIGLLSHLLFSYRQFATPQLLTTLSQTTASPQQTALFCQILGALNFMHSTALLAQLMEQVDAVDVTLLVIDGHQLTALDTTAMSRLEPVLRHYQQQGIRCYIDHVSPTVSQKLAQHAIGQLLSNDPAFISTFRPINTATSHH